MIDLAEIQEFISAGLGLFWMSAFAVLVYVMPVRVMQKRHGYSLWVLLPCLLPLGFAFSVWVGVSPLVAGPLLVLFFVATPWVFALATPRSESEAHI